MGSKAAFGSLFCCKICGEGRKWRDCNKIRYIWLSYPSCTFFRNRRSKHSLSMFYCKCPGLIPSSLRNWVNPIVCLHYFALQQRSVAMLKWVKSGVLVTCIYHFCLAYAWWVFLCQFSGHSTGSFEIAVEGDSQSGSPIWRLQVCTLVVTILSSVVCLS